MIREICKDEFILSMKSTDASKDDLYIAQDLLDTVLAHKDTCVGMAANMIGELKNIIVFLDKDEYKIMINPKIIKKSYSTYKTAEGCLSLKGERETIRYDMIKVEFYDINMKKYIKTYHDFTAQIIQHQIDHLNGIII